MFYDKLNNNTLEKELSENATLLIQNVSSKIVSVYGSKYQVLSKYLHIVPEKIDESMIIFLESELNARLPQLYKDFLYKCNGIELFSGLINIYGFGRIIKDNQPFVSRDPKIVLPYHISDYNRNLRKTKVLEVGTVLDEKIIIDLENDKYISIVNNKGKVILKGCDLEDLLSKLYAAATKYYSKDGVVKSPLIIGDILFNRPKEIKGDFYHV